MNHMRFLSHQIFHTDLDDQQLEEITLEAKELEGEINREGNYLKIHSVCALRRSSQFSVSVQYLRPLKFMPFFFFWGAIINAFKSQLACRSNMNRCH